MAALPAFCWVDKWDRDSSLDRSSYLLLVLFARITFLAGEMKDLGIKMEGAILDPS
jgi:hypothetical protein